MKILQINSAKNFGGGERHLIDLAHGLTMAGHTVLFALRRGNRWDAKLKDFDAGSKYLLPLVNSIDLLSVWKLAKIIRQNEIDIVHAHVARDYPLAVFAAQLAGNKAQVVLTRHVLFSLKSLHKILFKKVSAVVAVSQATEEKLIAQNLFSPEKIKYVPNALNFDDKTAETKQEARVAFRRSHNIGHDEWLVSIIGELKHLKGQQDFLQAAALVSQKFPNVKFAVVGKDNSKKGEFRKSLEILARENNLTDKTLWFDFLDNVSPVLYASDVFVSASHTESFGISILEAMAAGTTVVATKTAGAGELLQNDKTGKLVALENAQEIAAAVCALLKSGALRRELSEAAQSFARIRFSLVKMINATEQIYFECKAEQSFENSSNMVFNPASGLVESEGQTAFES